MIRIRVAVLNKIMCAVVGISNWKWTNVLDDFKNGFLSFYLRQFEYLQSENAINSSATQQICGQFVESYIVHSVAANACKSWIVNWQKVFPFIFSTLPANYTLIILYKRNGFRHNVWQTMFLMKGHLIIKFLWNLN